MYPNTQYLYVCILFRFSDMQALTPRLHMTSIDIANLVAGDGPPPPAWDPRTAPHRPSCVRRARVFPARARVRRLPCELRPWARMRCGGRNACETITEPAAGGGSTARCAAPARGCGKRPARQAREYLPIPLHFPPPSLSSSIPLSIPLPLLRARTGASKLPRPAV